MKQPFLFLFVMGLCHGVINASLCTDRGRYPNDDTGDCRGYTMCLIGGITNFTQYKLTCPKGFIYSHLEQQCTNATGYNCLPSYNCTNPGNYVNPESENCTSYIACVEGISDLVTARMVRCSSNTVFNPNTQVCDNETDYECSVKNINLATVVGIEDDLITFYGNFSFNTATNVYVKSLTLFSMMTLFVLY